MDNNYENLANAIILQAAKEEAFQVVSEDPTLTHPRHAELRQVLFRRWEGRLQLARTA